MDLETPADAWYTYVAVSLVSVALAGLALGVPTGPPPDAPAAANAIEGATGSEYAASATYEHDAERVTIDRRTLTMENEHGTAHASFSYGVVVPVNGHERLENVADGRSIEAAYDEALRDGDRHAFAEFKRDVETAYDENTGEAIRADGELRARTVTVDSEIDDLEPIDETITVEVTDKWEPIAHSVPGWDPDPYIGEVGISYEGAEDRRVSVEMTGEYRLSDIVPDRLSGYAPGAEDLEEETQLYAGSDGEVETSYPLQSDESIRVDVTVGELRADQPARDPVEFEFELSDPDGELPEKTGRLALEYGDEPQRWSNEIERELDFDHDHPAIGVTDGGNYCVTLVKV